MTRIKRRPSKRAGPVKEQRTNLVRLASAQLWYSTYNFSWSPKEGRKVMKMHFGIHPGYWIVKVPF